MRSNEKAGYVYVLSNPGMPGLLKIGRSISGGRSRASQMDGTGIPYPFDLEFECWFSDCEEAELLVHEALQYYRVSARREFFQTDVCNAIVVILNTAAGYVEHTVSHQDLTVCSAAMEMIASSFGLCPPDPYRLIEYMPKSAWAEAVANYKRRYPLRLASINTLTKGAEAIADEVGSQAGGSK